MGTPFSKGNSSTTNPSTAESDKIPSTEDVEAGHKFSPEEDPLDSSENDSNENERFAEEALAAEEVSPALVEHLLLAPDDEDTDDDDDDDDDSFGQPSTAAPARCKPRLLSLYPLIKAHRISIVSVRKAGENLRIL